MSEVKLEKNQQTKLKGLSKLIAVIAKICRIFLYIAIPCIILTMCIVPIIIKNANIEDNKIIFNYKKETLIMEEKSGKTYVYDKDKKVTSIEDTKLVTRYKKAVDKYSKKAIVTYIETGLILTITYLCLIVITLKHLGKLFKNISRGATPFTLDNVDHMRKMAIYMIITIIFPLITSVLYQLVADIDINISFGLFDIVETLFVLSMSFVFKYGYEIQKESNSRIYDEDL